MNKTESRSDRECTACGTVGTLFIIIAIFMFTMVGFLLAGGFVLILFVAQAGSLNSAGNMPGALPNIGMGATVLIVPALVLLLIILILLVILLWRSFGSASQLQALLKLLPLLKNVASSLNTMAEALYLIERGLREAQIPLRSVGSALHDAAYKVDITLPILTAQTKHFDLLGTDVMIGLKTDNWKPFGEVKTNLQTAGAKLEGNSDSLDSKFGDTADQCHSIADGLKVIAQALSQL